MSSLDQLELDMIRLSELKKQLQAFEELKKEYEEVRAAVLNGMQAQKSKRTDAINGYFAVRAERRSVSVTSPQAVEQWMTENGFQVEEYKRLDDAMVKQLNESIEKEYKKTIPGIETSLTEYVTIKEAQDAN